MASELHIEIRGIEEIQRKAEKVADMVARSGILVAKGAMVIERQAKINATGRPGPYVRTGRLRASILPEILSPILARVGTNVYYAPYVEFGHFQHVGQFVPPLKKRLVRAHAPAYPFMGPTIEQTKSQIHDVVATFGRQLGAEWAA